MMKLTFAFGLALLFIGAICADDTSPFKITTKRSDDRVEVKSKGDKVVFDVRSQFGIGSATIERTIEQWPDKVVVQLRLKGLEKFKVSTDKLAFEASVSSQNGDARLWKHGKEDSPLNSKSPYWMQIRIMDTDGKLTKAISVKDGYVYMQLPMKFFDDNPKAIKLDWIDFYRN